jgi:hypothetical protein
MTTRQLSWDSRSGAGCSRLPKQETCPCRQTVLPSRRTGNKQRIKPRCSSLKTAVCKQKTLMTSSDPAPSDRLRFLCGKIEFCLLSWLQQKAEQETKNQSTKVRHRCDVRHILIEHDLGERKSEHPGEFLSANTTRQ